MHTLFDNIFPTRNDWKPIGLGLKVAQGGSAALLLFYKSKATFKTHAFPRASSTEVVFYVIHKPI